MKNKTDKDKMKLYKGCLFIVLFIFIIIGKYVFPNRNLNRCICGYGITEGSAPYLCDLVSILHNQKIFDRDVAYEEAKKKINDLCANKNTAK